jgi:nucleotide-binding universal stress UspA family protein
MFKTIVLGLDGSVFADHAIPVARGLALEDGARLEVVHVREIIAPGKGAIGPPTRRVNEDEIEAKVRQQVDELRAAGIETRLHHITDLALTPAQHIAEVADETGADLIMVGTRGQGLVVGLILGSVTHRLLQIAPCSVLAVPPPSRWRDQHEAREAAEQAAPRGTEVGAGAERQRERVTASTAGTAG